MYRDEASQKQVNNARGIIRLSNRLQETLLVDSTSQVRLLKCKEYRSQLHFDSYDVPHEA
jgi:hypothetical protein